jgi:hypothetical protein
MKNLSCCSCPTPESHRAGGAGVGMYLPSILRELGLISNSKTQKIKVNNTNVRRKDLVNMIMYPQHNNDKKNF